MSNPERPCALCGESVVTEQAVVGDLGSVCVDCVWMCVSILEDRGVHRPLVQKFDDEEETSAVFDRGSSPPSAPRR